MKHYSILVEYTLENSIYQIQVFNEMEFIKILNTLAAID
jgi:hypothetical protein